MDAPLVIAVQSNTELPTYDDHSESALYGVGTRRPIDRAIDTDAVLKPGLWIDRTGWRNADIPQVVAISDLAPWRVSGPIVSGPARLECVGSIWCVSEVVGRWTVEEFFAGTRPPTDDDVPTALDGTPLDTPAKLIAHLERINAERDRSEQLAG